jgi:hypothetical protein
MIYHPGLTQGFHTGNLIYSLEFMPPYYLKKIRNPFPDRRGGLDLQVIQGLTCAQFLSKMVEMASIKKKRVRCNNFSTSECGLCRKNLIEQAVLEKHSVAK